MNAYDLRHELWRIREELEFMTINDAVTAGRILERIYGIADAAIKAFDDAEGPCLSRGERA